MSDTSPEQVGTATQVEIDEEAALVQAAQDNRAAFAPLYRRYVHRVYRYLYSRVGHVADAEDLTAQIFTEALAGLGRYREQGSFAAWLFTIARRRVTDYYRRQKSGASLYETPCLSAERTGNPQAHFFHQETLQELRGIIAGLEEDNQELLRLRFAGDLSYREIGQLTGRSEAAAKMAVHRLLRRLEAAWEVEEDV